MYPTNFGLIEEELKPQDYILGGTTGVANTQVLQKDGHGWDAFLPSKELQKGALFDSYGCVSFSALNCLETLYKRKYGVPGNWSDRYTAKLSGTVPGQGNSLSKVGESIRKNNGLVEQNIWPNVLDKTVDVFYSEVPGDVQAKGKEFLSAYKVQYEFVIPSVTNLLFGLQYSPVQVTGFAWPTPVNGIYPCPAVGISPNHAFTLFDYKLNEYWVVFDHYDIDIKKLAWDFRFGSCLKYTLEKASTFNQSMAADLLKRGIQYIQRIENSGQVYKVLPDSLVFLDSEKGADKHIPLVDEVLRILSKEKKLVGISEADFTKLGA